MDQPAKKILIAEDEKPMANALKLKLEKSGFDAVTAFDGEEAIAALEKEKFDLLLLDIIMPRKDGLAVLAEMKTKGINVPVIISTNLSQEEDMKRTREFGLVVDYIVKSDTPIFEIVKKIENHLQAQT